MLIKSTKKLSTSLAIYISSVVILALIITNLFVYNLAYNRVFSSIETEIALNSKLAAKNINKIFDETKIVVTQMEFNSDIVNYLKTATTKDTILNNRYYLPVLKTLQNIKNSNPLFFLAWVANEKANFYLDNLNVIPDNTYEVKKRPWYKYALNSNEVAYTKPYVEWKTKKYVLSSIKAIKNTKKNILGFVAVDIKLDSIPLILKNSKSNNLDKVFLIAKDGTYIYNDDTSKFLDSNLNNNYDKLSNYKNLIINPNNNLNLINYNRKSYFLYSYKVANDWRIVSLIDKDNALAFLKILKYKIFTVIFITLVLILLVIYFIANHFTLPLKSLVVFATDINNRKLNKNIPNDYLIRNDEIGEISNSFQVLINYFRNEKKLLENTITMKNEELESQYKYILETEKAASLGNLVAGVAHEINTPLGVSVTTASYIEKLNHSLEKNIMSDKLKKSDLLNFIHSVNESSNILNTNLNHAANLVNNFKKLAVHQATDEKILINLKDITDMTILSLKPLYKKKNIIITNNISEEVIIKNYPSAFTQLFNNLIINSLTHGFANKNEGIITIDCKIDKENISIIYSDNGKGISEDTQEKMYEPFYTTNRIEGNSGLGMHIVFNIVRQLLLGEIKCISKVNSGVTFIITFKINDVDCIN
ncbi:sensor histidine kinase [Helicovermis profundi]|uniref:histidine kinase n=1 Tax=Helicovermis profundi TaxID=3065157 RepID=A0AAU9EBE9_9FIRM|nr:hypothetical protein HLPR_02030 [Clostridia bacterium S502]